MDCRSRLRDRRRASVALILGGSLLGCAAGGQEKSFTGGEPLVDVTVQALGSDGEAPFVTSYDAGVRASSATVPKISWQVGDSGGSRLKSVEVFRALLEAVKCSDDDRSGCGWTSRGVFSAPTNADQWQSSMVDPSPAEGTYWYAIRVTDQAGNQVDSRAQSPIKVVRLRAPASDRSPAITKKVLLAIYDPQIFDDARGVWRTAHDYTGGADPELLAPQIVKSLYEASGGFVDYQIVKTVKRAEFPVRSDGFRFDQASYKHCLDTRNDDDCHTRQESSYAEIFRDFDIANQIKSGQIDEVFVYSGDYFAIDELAVKIPGDATPYDMPENGWLYQYRKKDIPDTGRTTWVMGFNYVVGVDNALESYGHRIETALGLTVGRGHWEGCAGHPVYGPSDFDHFSCVNVGISGTPVTVAGCGTAHYLPNSRVDYDDGNTAIVTNACQSFRAYPFTQKTLVSQNCSTWGCERFTNLNGWMSGLPYQEGTTSNGNLRNWWKYIADFDNAVVATRAGQTKLWLEAEDATVTAPLLVLSDPSASAGRYWSVQAGRNGASPPTDGIASHDFSVPAAGAFKVWGRVIAPVNSDDSFYVRMDSGPWVKWNDLPLGASWHWDDVHNSDANAQVMQYNLTRGAHRLQVAYREDGAKLDQLLITDVAGYVPSGVGDAPYNLYLEAETANVSPPMQVVDGERASGSFVTVAAGNNSTAAAPATGYASYAFSVRNAGFYKVWGKLLIASGDDDSFWVRMDGGKWVKWNGIPTGNVWHWDDVHDADAGNKAMQYSLAAGAHTLDIAYREDGAKLDRLLITSDLRR